VQVCGNGLVVTNVDDIALSDDEHVTDGAYLNGSLELDVIDEYQPIYDTTAYVKNLCIIKFVFIN